MSPVSALFLHYLSLDWVHPLGSEAEGRGLSIMAPGPQQGARPSPGPLTEEEPPHSHMTGVVWGRVQEAPFSIGSPMPAPVPVLT